MRRMGITGKIWLSIAVFALGACLAIFANQVQSKLSEGRLAQTSEALFPAAQHGQEAEAAFQRMAKAFQDAVLVEDASALDTAEQEGKAAADALGAAAKLPGLSDERSAALAKLESTVRSTARDARSAYQAMIGAGANLTPEVVQASRDMATRMDALRKDLRANREALAADLQTNLEDAVNTSVTQRWLSLGIFVATLAIAGVVVTVTIRRQIVQPIQTIAELLEESATQVSTAAASVASSSQSLSRGATDQAASLEETSASMEEMASMTRQNAQNSQRAAEMMGEAERIVHGANGALTEMVTSMTAIKESSDKVAKIIKTIDEIAFQTNILALNAAVEAARAGEAGMGFAVVADEVRALAQRSAQAARDTAELIEESIGRSDEGHAKVDQVTTAMHAITSSTGKVKEIIDQVSLASRQQSQGIDQVSQAIAQMEKVTQSTAATAEESAAASEELNHQAGTSRTAVSRLASLVGGATAASPSPSKPAAPVPAAKRTSVAKVVAMKQSRPATSRVNPDAEIPLGDTGTFGSF
jgi:methyl-accepting chemotaxis protein